MRKIVLQMMTTLNGRLDDPMDWMGTVIDPQYRRIEEFYSEYDTVLVGRETYDEMVAYWPSALESGEGTDSNRAMAQNMHDLRKLVFSRDGRRAIAPWHNAEQVTVPTDDDLAAYLTALKQQDGKTIHLSGGSRFARAVIALDLVDEFRFFVYPIVSPGDGWFAGITDRLELELVEQQRYENGAVLLRYLSLGKRAAAHHERFTELLA